MRKSILLFIAIFIGILESHSQNQKKDINLSIIAAPISTYNSNDIGLIASFGTEYFFANKFSASSNLIASNNILFSNESGNNIKTYSLVPSVQYYFLNNPKFNVFTQAGFGFGIEDFERENNKNSTLQIFTLGVGFNAKMFDKLFFKVLIPYVNARNTTLELNAIDGLGAFIGFDYKL